MKAKSILIAAAIILQGSLLFAGISETKSTPGAGEYNLVTMNILAPVTPAEATFEDVSFTGAGAADISVLAPSVPAEASFEDAEATAPEIPALAPSTPAVADFETV
jgi:hypothetical protein